MNLGDNSAASILPADPSSQLTQPSGQYTLHPFIYIVYTNVLWTYAAL